jgi:hypothetical protein
MSKLVQNHDPFAIKTKRKGYLVRQVREFDCLGASVLVNLNLVVARNGQKSAITEL